MANVREFAEMQKDFYHTYPPAANTLKIHVFTVYFDRKRVVKSINFRPCMQDQFRTIITPAKASFSITHKDRIISIGSCFSENIGRYFLKNKFDIEINPFGQQYNPASIANAIDKLLTPTPYKESELVLQDELYHSFDHHGDFSKPTVAETLEGINTSLNKESQKLTEASVLFLTFGTAHVFKRKETGKTVSNCHKIPGSQFDFELMTPEEIVEALSKSIDTLFKRNPDLRIILTVSPVRYFAFGHFENSVSKGHLFAAINALIRKYPQAYYFPAYEIVMDDLRDYRFFADDMLHPTAQAIEYVWEKVVATLLPAETQVLLQELVEIENAVNHRPRNATSEAHRKFKERYLAKIKVLEEKFGFDFSEEKVRFSV
ncbi:MAG: hypothetical protein JWO03_1422 [Bacteroidetes bacterium]|nr:hypothetical protein [Bacteroidota bacterium]